MIVRDPLTVSECGIHVRGPDDLGSGPRCPACLRMNELARTGPLTEPRTALGHPKSKRGPQSLGNARVRRGKAPQFVTRRPNDRAIALRGKDGQRQ